MKHCWKRAFALVLTAAVLLGVLPVWGSSPDYEWGFVKKVPMKPKYTEEVEHHGTVETLHYTTHSYAMEALAQGDVATAYDDNPDLLPIDRDLLVGDETEFVMEKELLVYLPYGYDPAQPYNVVYALHGTGENETYWIGDGPIGQTTRKLLDRMIDVGECAPFILVTPCYYSIPEDKAELFPDLDTQDMLANVWPMYFWEEMRNEIIPLIDSTYSTYADQDDARDHRGFVGLSRGSMTTINSVMMHELDQFSYFGNFSGVWCDFDAFKATLESDPYKDLEIKFWYNGNGSGDFALEHHEAFKNRVLAEMPDRFVDGDNFAWICFRGGAHAYNAWLPDLYNSMLVFFTK